MRAKTYWTAVLLLVASAAYSQTAKWSQDYDKALVQAKNTGKTVLVDFSGSDWCSWCMRLEKEVFSQKAFKKYAKDNLILVLVDFPRKKHLPAGMQERNERLAQQYGIEGFPTVVLINAKGETIAQTGYQPGGAANYVNHLKELIGKAKK
jgi:protein disulfide-isomerase